MLAVAVGGDLLGIIVVVRGKFFLVSKNFVNFLSSSNEVGTRKSYLHVQKPELCPPGCSVVSIQSLVDSLVKTQSGD